MALIGVIWLVGALFIIPLGPLTAGLFRVTQRFSEERTCSWREMITHVREDFRWSSLLLWSLVGGLILLIVNTQFYAGSPNQFLRYLTFTFLLFIVLWIGVMVVAFAMALRQQAPTVRRTLRNSVLMVLANAPGILISLFLLFVTSFIFLLLPPLFLLIPGWISLWGAEQTRLLLVRAGYLQPDEIADRFRGE